MKEVKAKYDLENTSRDESRALSLKYPIKRG